jgi:hypothetical protein
MTTTLSCRDCDSHAEAIDQWDSHPSGQKAMWAIPSATHMGKSPDSMIFPLKLGVFPAMFDYPGWIAFAGAQRSAGQRHV